MKNHLLAVAERSRIRRKDMTVKDERIGFRVPSDIKASLLQIAKKEGRSLAQVCELLLRGGISEYERDGAAYIHRLLSRAKEKSK